MLPPSPDLPLRATVRSSSGTDLDLARRVAAGQAWSADELIDRHLPSAVRLASIVANGPRADALVAEASIALRRELVAGRLDVGVRVALLRRVLLGSGVGEDALGPNAGSRAERAIRQLPERWLTVLWHQHVEHDGLMSTAIATGLPAREVLPLTHRAEAALAQVYAAVAHVPAPADVASPLPSDLGDVLAAGVLGRHGTRYRAVSAEAADRRRARARQTTAL